MAGNLDEVGPVRLEGLCGGPEPGAGRIRIGPAAPGIERAAAHLRGGAFAPHRHDTHAIGLTLAGAQTFTYRGARRHCLPGPVHVLHPDEIHDGAAGTEEGFGYRIASVDPALIQGALGGRPLPFVADPVVSGPWPGGPLAALWRIDEPVGEAERIEAVAALADGLLRLSGSGDGPPRALRLAALTRVRDLIAADPAAPVSAERLQREAGLDRWALARGFRAAFGTSPSGFRTMRQLDRARALIRQGAALAVGFADQSHLSRHFKRAHGITPARWAALTRSPRSIGSVTPAAAPSRAGPRGGCPRA